MFNSEAIITDSGWLQKEAYILWKNIFTVRDTTEWVETVESWRNKLILDQTWKLLENVKELIENYRWGEYIDFYWEWESLDNLFSKII
jgi:UDP-N-acetylglucosamine 2-epimerase